MKVRYEVTKKVGINFMDGQFWRDQKPNEYFKRIKIKCWYI